MLRLGRAVDGTARPPRYVVVSGSDEASDCIDCDGGKFVESGQASDCITGQPWQRRRLSGQWP